MKQLNETVGSCEFDNLIYQGNPVAEVFSVNIATGQGILKRGSVLAMDEKTGACALLDTGGDANCILADDIDTGTVPAKQPGQAAKLVEKYAAKYAAAGITVEDGKIVYEPTGKIDPEITHKVGETTSVYVGLTFTKPADAKTVTIECNGSILKAADGRDIIDLSKDSDDVIGGDPVIYFDVADASGKAKLEKTFNIKFTWKDSKGVSSVTYFTAARFSDEYVEGVAYRTGHFNRGALIVATGYTLSNEDEQKLRKCGILLSTAL